MPSYAEAYRSHRKAPAWKAGASKPGMGHLPGQVVRCGARGGRSAAVREAAMEAAMKAASEAAITEAAVTEAAPEADAATEARVAPEAAHESPMAAEPAPVGAEPDGASEGWKGPVARHPGVVAIVAWHPDVSRSRRRDADADAHRDAGIAGERGGYHERQRKD